MLMRRLARRARFLSRLSAAFARSARGTATVEFVLIFPAVAGLLGIIVYGGEGFEIDRKLTMTVRTLADIASQQQDVGAGQTYPASSLLTAASQVIAPYDTAPLSMVLSEVQVTASGTGKVAWSKATTGATALTVGSTVTTPANITSGYLILGTASYSYNPLQLYYSSNAITLSSSLYLSPRKAPTTSTCPNPANVTYSTAQLCVACTGC